ncbi:MAG: DUF3857 domain-containing protein [Bacteroidota bacterium]
MKSPLHFFALVLAAVLICSFHGNLSAQEKIKFGKINIDDLKMTRCPFDSAADAMILCDIGSSHYEYSDIHGYELLFDRLLRIKIFTKKGYSEANQEIEYYYSGSTNEVIETLKGATYNLESDNVSETKLSDESIHEEVLDVRSKSKKISFPAIREGSIIELKYTVRSPFVGHVRTWYFQGDLPIRRSEYEVRIPYVLQFGRQATGYYPFVVNTRSVESEVGNFDVNVEKYATRDVPSMKEESFARSTGNYATKIRYELRSYKYSAYQFHELTTTWDVIIKDLVEDDDFGKQVKKSGLVKTIVSEINSADEKPFDKMVDAHSYIRKHFKWNGRNSLYPTDNLKKAFNEQLGNSADINLSLILLLRELNLDAVPVVLSTWNNGIVLESNPTLNGLNYVLALVKIDSTEYLLDATSASAPYHMIPKRCLNGSGIVISPGITRWVKLLAGEKENDLTFADLKIDSAGNIQGKLETSKTGYSAIESREDFLSSGEEAFTKSLKQGIKSWEVGDIKYENMEKPDLVMKIIYSLNSAEICQVSGDMIYLNVLAGMGQNSNPFSLEKRTYPVDFRCPQKDTYVFNFEIPAGYKVESLPEPVKLSLPDQAGSFKFIIAAKDNKIMVSSMMTITKTLFLTSEYEILREFFTRIVAKHAQQIVLKKI